MSTKAAPTVPRHGIDPAHSSAKFKFLHIMISDVKGEFSRVNGNVTYDQANPAASFVDVTIDPASIRIHDLRRVEHLKSPDFFDGAKSAVTLRSKEVESLGKDSYKLPGDLTIRDITVDVEMVRKA